VNVAAWEGGFRTMGWLYWLVDTGLADWQKRVIYESAALAS
jgi:hypothetical protein